MAPFAQQLIRRLCLRLGIRRSRFKRLAKDEQRYEQEYLVTKYRTNIVSGVLTTLSFTIIDYLITPDHWKQAFALRLIAIPVGITCWLAYRSKIVREKYYLYPAFGTAIYLGLLIGVVSSKAGYENSIHFYGLMLSMNSIVGQVPWRRRHLGLVMLMVCGPFWIGVFSRYPNFDGNRVIADMILFAAAFSIIRRFYTNWRSMRRGEFLFQALLERTNRKQKVLIEQKTREGIYLERLASQFSPQVIDHIKRGSLDLETRVRRPVTCIFVDVQNSTSRASRIDHRNYTELMAAFFDGCVKVFLKHNVTVGTYLGDGILAFTNAPNEDPEYRRNAMNACLEILALHQKKQRIYFETWRTEFNIRIGVEHGYATVGFFPSREHGTYTALGETVSMAARLCARAELNSVAVTKKFLTSLPFENSTLRISKVTTAIDIKGLEGEAFEVYSVRPPESKPVPISHCPSCELAMETESMQHGASFFVCAKCSYRELIPTDDAGDASKKAA